MAEHEPYAYGERKIEDMSAHALRIGEGRISAYLSAVLGAMSVLAVMCFRYPTWLTTEQLRAEYDVGVLRIVLMVAMGASLAFALFAFVRNKKKRWGSVGVMLTLLAFVLGGWRAEVGEIDPHAPSLGVDWLLLDLLLSAGLFVFIEKMFPKYPDQVILRPEWRLDMLYFGINHLLVGVLFLVGNAFAPTWFGWAVHDGLQNAVRGLPLVVQVVLLMLCADFVQYWIHRAYHEVPWLWDLHAVHHSAEHMDWLAGSRMHFVQTLIDRTLAMVPLYLLGPDKVALDIYVLVASFQAVFAHANVGVRTGPLKYLLVTPQFHHWHHSSDRPAIDTNYAVHLPLLDKLFGTYHMPDDHWPRDYGTVTRLPRTFGAQLAYPFKGLRTRMASMKGKPASE